MLKLNKIIISGILTVPIVAHANCTKVTSTSSLSSELIAAGYTAGSWTGACDSSCGGSSNINNVVSISTSGSIMPSGTLLATSVATTLESGRVGGYEANHILYRCALADADSLYEMYSLRGQGYDYFGYRITDEIEDGYYSYVRNVAFRLKNTLTGEYYSRYWKSRKLTSESWVQDDSYIYIPASAFSDVVWELFKIDSTTYGVNSATRYVYARPTTIGRTVFKGPGLDTANMSEGEDSRTEYKGWYANWPSAWNLTGVIFVRGATCMIQDYPTVVSLPTIRSSSLSNGETSASSFDISLSCESSAVSSVNTSTTSSANVAMGFLVNQSTAVTAATNLGLVTSNGGLTHLLDTHYGSSGVASGVGIRIYNESGTALNLLSSTTPATGNTGGWYAYKDLTTSQDDSTDGLTTYTGNFTASLEAISGETVTAGSVNAQLQVVVSFQ